MSVPIYLMFAEVSVIPLIACYHEQYLCDAEVIGIHEEAGIPTATVRVYGTDTFLVQKPYLDARNGQVRDGDRVSVIRVGETYYAYRSLK